MTTKNLTFIYNTLLEMGDTINTQYEAGANGLGKTITKKRKALKLLRVEIGINVIYGKK